MSLNRSNPSYHRWRIFHFSASLIATNQDGVVRACDAVMPDLQGLGSRLRRSTAIFAFLSLSARMRPTIDWGASSCDGDHDEYAGYLR